MSKICGDCTNYVPPVPANGHCSADPEKGKVDWCDHACKDYVCEYDNSEQDTETSSWYFDPYIYDHFCKYCCEAPFCKYCGKPSDERLKVGYPFAEPSFGCRPRCEIPMKEVW